MKWRNWVRGPEIEPSLYAADFARLGEQVEALMDAGARIFHFDVGDGHFVEPVTMGPIVLRSISGRVHERGGVLDCHLMVENPDRHFSQIADAGGDSVTFHVEVASDAAASAARARELGLGVGFAFNPETAVADAVATADGAELVLCMSIHPGYSGQTFLPESLGRIAELRAALPEEVFVQVDGGIGEENVAAVSEAGATLVVAGSAVFAAHDIAAAYRGLARAVA
ncbi:MAG: ribulose-phosphate 3-epimerase [Thermoleophilia bacterium]|nr:ribulose-phosphate 3-epimerase [Thermoleophilia bacterium]MDQ3859015.1 ribulose-phosphate 3-epimerase [Actinomycetota bacterium]